MIVIGRSNPDFSPGLVLCGRLCGSAFSQFVNNLARDGAESLPFLSVGGLDTTSVAFRHAGSLSKRAGS